MRVPTATDDDLRRALAFERRSYELVAGRVQELPYGVAYLEDQLRLVYPARTLWVTATEVEGDQLHADADAVLGSADDGQRCVIVEHEPLWDAVAGAFSAQWEARTFAFMAHRGDAAGQPPAAAAREISREEMLEAEQRHMRTQLWGQDAEQRRQIGEHHRRLGLAGNERCFAAYADGEVAGYAKLRHRDGVAQVEDVVVVQEHRGKGLGRLVTTAAVQAGMELEPDLLFIVAWDHDWPQRLYAKLGFEHIGRARLFRTPQV